MEREKSKDTKTAETIESRTEAMRKQVSRKQPKAVNEPVYLADEFAANARRIFGTRPECVVAALKAVGKSEYTVSEAKQIVEKFLKREVK